MTDEQDTKDPDTKDPDVKVKTSISLSPYLFEWVVGLVKNKKIFASNSDAITTALSEMKGRMECREEHVSEFDTAANAQKSTEDFESLMLQLLDAHQDLVEEANELRRKQHGQNKSIRKVTFR